MDREAVIRQLRAWAEGIDPVSGEALPADHPVQRTDLVRTLYGALALLEAGGRSVQAPARSSAMTRGEGPRNAGMPWSPEDDRALGESFDRGEAVASLAKTLERTRGAVTARLVRLGKIEPPASLRLRGAVTPDSATGAEH
jgi:hypothetical protein